MSAATPASPRCCRRWPARRTDASSPHLFDPQRLTEILVADRRANPSNYSVVLVSEGATVVGDEERVYEDDRADQFGHRQLDGIGDRVSEAIREYSPRFNDGREIRTVNRRLGYRVCSGALDSIVRMALGNHPLDLIPEGEGGLLVAVHDGVYDTVSLDAATEQKMVDVGPFYHTERPGPRYTTFASQPLFIMTRQP